jgi:WD40 repeat protein
MKLALYYRDGFSFFLVVLLWNLTMRFTRLGLTVSCVLGFAAPLPAQQPPSYAKQVKPFLAKYCLECHNAEDAKGGLVMASVATLLKGGDNGPVLVPGKPNESRLVLLPEHKAKPPMPPKKAKQPKPAEIALLRAWIAAGAKDDSARVTVKLPDIRPRKRTPPPISALAYRPDGKLLAVGAQQAVLFLDPASGDVTGQIAVQKGKVTALAFSPDGQQLAVASSTPGTAAEILLYVVAHNLADLRLQHVLAGHKDLILDLAFRPDGKQLASTGFDRLIKLWDVATGKELRTLKDHSDAVYGLAFSPDGRLLGSAAADRAVKVWDVASGKRLYTLGEATDWLYAIAWSPEGRHLAAAGVDKSIRVWEVSRTGGKIVHSVFADEAAITRLIYAADAKTLYSVSEDRTIKAWDTIRMVERNVYPRQPEAVLAFAVRPDHKQLALGRYDGAALLLDEATGKVQSEPLPIKPKPPQLAKLGPSVGQRGQRIRVTFEGKYLDTATEVTSSYAGLQATVVGEGKSPTSLQADVTFPPDTPAGIYKLGIKTPAGQTTQLPFIVDLFPTVAEVKLNDSPRTSQKVLLPVTVAGTLRKAGSIDYYRFDARAGQQIGAQVVSTATGSKLDPILGLFDDRGHLLTESKQGVLGYPCARAGSYALGVRDRQYRGNGEMHYHLHLGAIPVVTAVFPLGLQRGTEADIAVEGVHLGETKVVHVKASTDAAIGSRLPLAIRTPSGKPLGDASVVVGEFPEVVSIRPGLRSASPVAIPSIPVPGTANGRIDQPGTTETWRFLAKKAQRLIVEVNAQRLGSPLDSYLEILDPAGKPVPRATLRCVAKTYVTFRDHNSTTTSIRIESWNELAMNDYVWVGNELLRIWELPRNPDDDCRFFGAGKQRIGYLETTPTYISQGMPMYKVTIHPPGTTFPPNGFPVIHLDYRNDDGGPGYGKDSRIVFDPPADGAYQVRIGDSRVQGGPTYAYRLTVRPPRPSFNVHFSPTAPAVWKGGSLPITVSAERSDGFEDAIALRLENLPAGFSAPATTIPAGENNTVFALTARADTSIPEKSAPLKLVARATIDGHEVVREVTGGVPKLVEPGDLRTTTEQTEVSVRPGQQVRLTAKIERRNGFKGRVPLEVRGLPHGVRVLDIGLNGILITEKETSRTFVIYAEPWVKPTTQPFVVLATSERKGTEHAAKSVLLKVQAAASKPRQVVR